MKKSEQPSSFLQQEQQQSPKIQKQQSQFKALFFKNTLLQSKQKCTNVCQIITPIICLIFTYLIKTVAEDGLKTNIQFDDNKYPYKYNNYDEYDTFNKNITRNPLQYLLFQCSQSQNCNKTFLGQNTGTSKAGMLGQIASNKDNVPFYPTPYQNNNSFGMSVPFFIEANPSLQEDLFHRLEVLGYNSFKQIKQGHGLDYLPDGAVKFTDLNASSLKAQLKVNDCRDLQYHRVNGISKNKQTRRVGGFPAFNQTQFTSAYGLLNIMHLVSSSFIKQVTPITVESGFLLMPSVDQNSFVDTLINSISALIYPLGLSLLFPVFLYGIVLQKQERLVQMMKMNGLKIRYYWLTFFVFNLLLCVVTHLIFYLLGTFVLSSSFFVKTSKTLFFLVSLGWSLAQIGMAAFFQTFLNKSRSANIIGYLISIWTTMIGATLNLGSYQFPSELPIGLQMIPPFAFVRIFYLMMMSCSTGDCIYDMGLLTQELKTCITFLYIGFVFFFLLGAYLFQVIPQQFGVRRSPLFPFYSLAKIFRKKKTIQINTSQDPQLRDYISEHEEDSFSKNQRQKVIHFSSQQDQQRIKNQYPLIINSMRKLYKKQGIDGFYPAVRSFNLAIGKKQTFGLLGPNGAGKTTLISMITGMYQPNYGNAWIGGYDIQSSIEKAQLQMGVCPQFDLVWPQLSVQQHLFFYARLKGIPSNKIKQQVLQSMKEVKLQNFATFAAQQLSGGMKRRLSVAISLVGDPKIVFLDEPSTGLDPQNRRQLWAVLAECQTKRALFITTHMMQQADTLCNRIGIITSGVLRTIQTPMKLKKAYGDGYDVIINTLKEERQLISRQSLHLGIEQERWYNQEAKIRQSIGSFIQNQANKAHHMNEVNKKIVQFMKKQFVGTYLFKHFRGYLIFKVPSTYKISDLFETMHSVEKQLGFSDIAITNSSLEDVFMKVVQKFDTDQKKFYPYNSDDLEQKKPNQNQNYKSKQQGINYSQQKFKQVDAKKKRSQNQQHFDSVVSKKRDSILSQNESRPNNSQHKQHREEGQDKKSLQRDPKKDDDESSDYF